jgi:osmotically-inducible protein OsmY
MANRIARQLRADAVPTTDIEDVTIVARGGNVCLKGSVEGHQDRDDIISSVQHVAGVNAIYDQLHIK